MQRCLGVFVLVVLLAFDLLDIPDAQVKSPSVGGPAGQLYRWLNAFANVSLR